MKKHRKNDPDYKRSRVLKAAKELFVENGYSSTSMSQIAEKSGVTQSMIHYYFDSKQGLFQAVIASSLEPLFRQRIFPNGTKGDFPTLLRASIRQRFRFFQKHPEVVKLLMRTSLMDEFQPSELAKRLGGRWVEIYRNAQDKGQIRSDIHPECIMVIYLALTTYWFQDNLTRSTVANSLGVDREKADEAFLETITTLFLESLGVREETP